jgi:hypothetical protein
MDKLLKYITKLETATTQEKKKIYTEKINFYYKQIGGTNDTLISNIGLSTLTANFKEDKILELVIKELCNILPDNLKNTFFTLYKSNDVTTIGKNSQINNLQTIFNNINCNMNVSPILIHMYILYEYYGRIQTKGLRINKVIEIIFKLIQCKIKFGISKSQRVLTQKDIVFIQGNLHTEIGKRFKENLIPTTQIQNNAVYAVPVKQDINSILEKLRII